MKFLRIHVITREDLAMLIKDGDCTCIEDINMNETDFCWDYAQQALVDMDKKEVIIWNDNIHTRIDDDIDNFLSGISYSGIEYTIMTTVMLEENMEQFSGVTY